VEEKDAKKKNQIVADNLKILGNIGIIIIVLL
jgi:hypothetical protein